MKELVQYVVESLVEFPDQIRIDEVEGERGTVLQLHVAQSDLGKVIGKQGRTARAIRTLLNASGIKSGKRTTLEIVE